MSRHKKPKITLEEQENEVLQKLYTPYTAKDGITKLKRTGEVLTLDETAVALRMIDGRKKTRPMSKIAVLKIQQRALEKIRIGLQKFGIYSLDDVLDTHRGRRNLATNFDCIDGNWN